MNFEQFQQFCVTNRSKSLALTAMREHLLATGREGDRLVASECLAKRLEILQQMNAVCGEFPQDAGRAANFMR
ncbi:hypothetical protein [Pseudomonas mangiferae]|uniref:Uncharacterized protein n=1 Tax=Pseudomonas mangiferae TaxID=2593654 RepID=A0A553GW30_9PSED|nr:hypothetical protein [Pseudomonas mangiferae]TRX73712.1 hypothetical protein FM069_16395 [Pseudomonas mangiferae]